MEYPPQWDSAADIFSVGMTLYEILTRQLPFHEEPDNTMVERHIVKGIRPSIPLSATPLTLAKAVELCWKASPMSRPSAKELINFFSDSKCKMTRY